jgi:alpha-glucosidase
MLTLYREALRLRRAEPALGDGPMRWLPAPEGVLAFARGAAPGSAPEPAFACVVNLSAAVVALPAHRAVLLASAPLVDGALAPDSAAWLRIA